MTSLQLTDLPWEDVIFRQIFPYLSVVDLCRLRRVCHGFLQLQTHYMASCTTLDMSTYIMPEEAFQRITLPCRNLRWFSVQGSFGRTDESLIPIFKNNPNLLHVNLNMCQNLSGAALQTLVVHCKKLKSLHLADCPWFSRGGWQVITLHLKNLEYINANSCWDVDDDTFRQFFSKFREIKTLHLCKVESVSDVTLYYLAKYCVDLEYLDVSFCWRITDNGIKQVVEYCKKLRFLDLEGCRDLSQSYVISLYTQKNIQVNSQYTLQFMVNNRRRMINCMGINLQI
ncbi:hypothetical protein SK128_003682 [Halocaridina rubra]|uniref:F-box/LRR-repeat protein 15-like leucin rich repeat domain-containing protein n=1 Tax=Halocaridina rubra TaxID=373956 RepID=A0AAN8XMU2_HALRR